MRNIDPRAAQKYRYFLSRYGQTSSVCVWWHLVSDGRISETKGPELDSSVYDMTLATWFEENSWSDLGVRTRDWLCHWCQLMSTHMTLSGERRDGVSGETTELVKIKVQQQYNMQYKCTWTFSESTYVNHLCVITMYYLIVESFESTLHFWVHVR